MNIVDAGVAWVALTKSIGPLSLEHSPGNVERMMTLLDELLESDDSLPGVGSLLEFVTQWVKQYESTNSPISQVSPVELLKHLMDVNGLKQKDLAEEFGGQSAVSAVLNGRRLISRRAARALSERFNVAAAAFFDEAATESEEVEDISTVVASYEGATVEGFMPWPSGAGAPRYIPELSWQNEISAIGIGAANFLQETRLNFAEKVSIFKKLRAAPSMAATYWDLSPGITDLGDHHAQVHALNRPGASVFKGTARDSVALIAVEAAL